MDVQSSIDLSYGTQKIDFTQIDAKSVDEKGKYRQPKCQGTYHARNLETGEVIEVEVIMVPDGKKKILCVFEFAGKDKHIPANETKLDFFFLVNRKVPLDNAAV